MSRLEGLTGGGEHVGVLGELRHRQLHPRVALQRRREREVCRVDRQGQRFFFGVHVMKALLTKTLHVEPPVRSQSQAKP